MSGSPGAQERHSIFEAVERRPELVRDAEVEHGTPEMLQLDVLDPMNRVVGELRPPTTPPALVPASALDQLAQDLLKRFSMSGNGSAGTVRLEFGSGLLEGGHLVVNCEGAEVSLLLDAPSALSETQLSELVDGMKARLSRRGLAIGEFEVRR